ncbi:hypothetical protein [Paenibacillus roseipurpureus]|uniref:Uncharacterized protein n=1 Tax=Paenibacillus roseopurpureus TaxID=2918901 RepID=A0AA96RMY9_9BACL|nr:hypothetical protein [Paenibacillus sp. MBLB1832]WNR46834.1 hypothetical protein MJB10_12320 [Paenibacillus sp. MBLB1832]
MTNDQGDPQSLNLAFSTPRDWLEDGKQIKVQSSPTLFGPVSYTIRSEIKHKQVNADLQLPDRLPINSLQLRLRVPEGNRLTGVEVNGKPYLQFDPNTETIDLTGITGKLAIHATYTDVKHAENGNAESR